MLESKTWIMGLKLRVISINAINHNRYIGESEIKKVFEI